MRVAAASVLGGAALGYSALGGETPGSFAAGGGQEPQRTPPPGPRRARAPSATLPAEDTVPVALSAWLRTLRRAASGKSTGPAAAVAWTKTLRWAATIMGIKIVTRRRFAGVYTTSQEVLPELATSAAPAAREPVQAEEDAAVEGLPAEFGPRCVRALQRLELPFFATSAEKVVDPVFGFKVTGNIRTGAAERAGETVAVVRRCLEAELGRPLVVHLLRREGEAAEASFDVMVTARRAVTTERSATSVVLLVGSLLLVVFLNSALGSSTPLQSLGAVVEPGKALPITTLCGLLGVGEVARSAAARCFGVRQGLPIFLPSPQVGVIGTASSAQSALPCRSSALAAALAGPATVALLSMLLAIYGMSAGSGAEVILHSPLEVAWPLALLPSRCDAFVWAGAQGVLMASLALLPHSPDGMVAWRSLHGRKFARQLMDATSYLYPGLAVICAGMYGEGWQVLPFWWAFLMVNASSTRPTPPLEEATEVPLAFRASAYLLLVLASLCALPLPLFSLVADAFVLVAQSA